MSKDPQISSTPPGLTLSIGHLVIAAWFKFFWLSLLPAKIFFVYLEKTIISLWLNWQNQFQSHFFGQEAFRRPTFFCHTPESSNCHDHLIWSLSKLSSNVIITSATFSKCQHPFVCCNKQAYSSTKIKNLSGHECL